MAIPTGLYGSETWVLIKKKDRSRIETFVIEFLRAMKGFTRFGRFINAVIRRELNMKNLDSRIDNYGAEWKARVDRMPAQRIPQQIKNYKQNGRRRLGRPRKRWIEQ